MRILLISDTHMYNEKMDHILEHEKYDIVIHCGDISVDEDDPHLKKMLVVQGNHDQSFLPITIKKNIDGYHCLITHGQKFDVYRGYDKLSQYMDNNDLQICFHGHTHVPTYIHQNNEIFINPGSVMINRAEYGFGTYAIVEIHQKNINVEFHHADTFEIVDMKIINEGMKILEEFKKLLK
ncbi:metallophosphoesterase family protein [Erysipelatoclostridium sp. AM42-17]|uniref:metallophosphoesterase family protein n=1 Tax=Erysipelatoclostridium sp. AM42-17 TaxID=2293102 RepID=UPI000E4DCF84|nr:YfcE family phosphodiesterase [Erysipelatoclostridium sp. AM42-17]RHS96384.1 YfcE family phosphodiesterase [Erysipelatoclostridium sp. AM42-17]